MKRFDGIFSPPLADPTRNVQGIVGEGSCEIGDDHVVFSGYALGFNLKRVLLAISISLASFLIAAGYYYFISRDSEETMFIAICGVFIAIITYRHKASLSKTVKFEVSPKGLGGSSTWFSGAVRIDVPGVCSKGAIYFRPECMDDELIQALEAFRTGAESKDEAKSKGASGGAVVSDEAKTTSA